MNNSIIIIGWSSFDRLASYQCDFTDLKIEVLSIVKRGYFIGGNIGLQESDKFLTED